MKRKGPKGDKGELVPYFDMALIPLGSHYTFRVARSDRRFFRFRLYERSTNDKSIFRLSRRPRLFRRCDRGTAGGKRKWHPDDNLLGRHPNPGSFKSTLWTTPLQVLR